MLRGLIALVPLVVAIGCELPGQSPDAARSLAVVRDIDAMASAAFADRDLPGLALVVLRNGHVVLSRGYGVADLEHAEPVSAMTVFQLGSISKQFLAALVLRLAERELVSLTDPVSRYLPDFTQLSPEVRVEHLLNHTSGIREPFTMPEYLGGIEDLDRGAGELVEILRRAPADFRAGARWSYSNANYMMLALLVERITEQPYEHAMAEELFRPLGLTSLRPCTPLTEGREEARGYVLRDGRNSPAAPENMNWIRGDGGICGHAMDVARWTSLLARGVVISPQAYRLMVSPTRLRDGREVDYGFGLSLVTLDGRSKVAHNGAMLGFSASAAYYPDEALTVVVLTNRGGVQTESIERRIARRLLGLHDPVLAARKLPSEARQRYVGSYDIGVFHIRLVDRGDRLWLEMPQPGPTTPLRYLGNGAFAAESDPEAYRLTFSEGDGPAEEVRLFMGAMHWYGMRSP